MQSLAMLREQLKNGGVIRPVYENLEGLELGGADDYDYNCCHDYNDESTVVTKTTITTSASMMSDARRAGVNLNQKHSYANNHIKKKSSPPSAPPLPPPTSDSRSTNSNNNNTSPKAQWGKGFISSEERQRKELRDKQKNFAVELKEQNKRKIFQQKRVKQQRIIEHQRKVENEAARVEREGGGGVGVFDYNGSGGGVWGDGDGDGGLPIPPQYAFSSSNDLLKTQKPGGKAAFKSGLTMDEDSLMRSLARLDFRLEEKKIVLESKSVCSGAGGEGRSRGGKRVGGGGGGGKGGRKGPGRLLSNRSSNSLSFNVNGTRKVRNPHLLYRATNLPNSTLDRLLNRNPNQRRGQTENHYRIRAILKLTRQRKGTSTLVQGWTR